ncbi:MAG: hypothetical protein HUU20_02310 [Pirellulales bacterium]|nr:hypothetical protein [Pirellulales bacterium]
MASVLLVTALVAIVLAAVRTAATASGPSKEWIAFAGSMGLVFGALAGAEIGAAQPRWIRGAMLGLVVGMLSGAVGGVMVAMPQCLLVVLIGAPLLVAFAAAVKHLSAPPSQTQETDHSRSE